MREFHVADLDARGELLATQPYRYEQLEQIPAAADLITHFATLLWRWPDEIETALPHPAALSFRWRSSSPTSGILVLRRDDGALASLSLLASGIRPDADRITLSAFQRHLLRELHGTATEPAFALMDLRQRPIVATVNFQPPDHPRDRALVALADRCFAAAYFRTLDLA